MDEKRNDFTIDLTKLEDLLRKGSLDSMTYDEMEFAIKLADSDDEDHKISEKLLSDVHASLRIFMIFDKGLPNTDLIKQLINNLQHGIGKKWLYTNYIT